MQKNILIKNSTWGLIQLLLTASLTLISIPIFIKHLGIELYGIFALISIIGNLNLLTNFGLNGALLIFLAQQKKCKESDYDIIVTQIILITFLTVVGTIVLIFKKFILVKILLIPIEYILISEKLLILLFLANSILLIGQTYTAIIDSLQKVYINNFCQLIYSIFYWGGLIIIVKLGGGLNEIGLVALLASIIWLVLVIFNAQRLWGKLNFNGLRIVFIRIAKKQISYGSKIYFSGLIGFLFEPLSKILLSNYINLQSVALFEIGSKIRGQINSLITKTIYPLFPYIANTQKTELLHKRIFNLSKLIQLIVIPLSVVVAFIMPILLKIWLGKDVNKDITIFSITMTITLLLLVPPVTIMYQYLSAKNKAEKNIYIQLLAVFINLGIFFLIFRNAGIYSILISNTIAYLTSYFLCNYYQIKYFKIDLKSELPYYILIFSFGVISTAICIVVKYLIFSSYFDILIYPLIIISLFILFVRLFNIISKDEINIYFETVPKLNIAINRVLIK